MPIYEYRCPRCNEEFELLVFSSTKVECPNCKCGKPERKMSVFGMAGTSEKGGSLASSGSSGGSSCSGCTSGSCAGCG